MYVEWTSLGVFDSPDGRYSVVFSCRIADGRTGLIDAPAVLKEDSVWQSDLLREEALAHDRHAEWREVLAFIAGADPIVQRAALQAP